jgi:signal transduction histidine kinase
VAAALEPSLRERQITLQSYAYEPGLVTGDADRLAQIAQNLLSNALRYTEPGGNVSVRVRPSR